MRTAPHRGAARVACRLLVCALLLAGIPLGGSAQAPHTILTGLVQDTEGFPLPRAELRMLDLDLATRSNENGNFDFGAVPPGTHYLMVWAAGHQPVQATLELGGGDSVTLAVTLQPGSEGWDVTDARADAAREARRREQRERTGFASRRANGGGFYLTREEIARERYNDIAEILRRVPGMRTSVDAYGRMHMQARGTVRMATGRSCNPVFFLDGVETTITPTELRGYPAEHVDAIEVYRGASELPPRFNVDGAMCGVVAIWTR